MTRAPQNVNVRRAAPDHPSQGEIVPGGANMESLANIPRDLAIIKMDNDSMLAMAAARPRDYGEIVKDIKNQLASFKSFAVNARYAKPVGKYDKCPTCKADTFYRDNCPGCGKPVPQKFATGLSIRAAEALAVSYRYNRIDSEAEDIDDVKTRLTVSFVDYQTGRVVRDSAVVSKEYKTRKGEIKVYDDDRFYGVVLKAKKSIMIRDAIMKMVPPGMRSELEVCVQEQLASFLDDNTVKAIVANFSQKNVTPEMLENHFGKRLDAFTKDDRALLASIWTSLEDGETTVEDIFGSPDTPKGSQAAAAEKVAQQAAGARKAAVGQGQAPAKTAPAAKAVEPPAKQAPQGTAAPAKPVTTPQKPVQQKPEPEAPAEPGLVDADGIGVIDATSSDPLAPDPNVKMPEKEPEEALGAIPPSEGTADDASGQPEQAMQAEPGLLDGLVEPESAPEPDMEAELRQEAFTQIKAACSKINQMASARGAKVFTEIMGNGGKLITAMNETGTRGMKSADQYSLDAMNGLLQRLTDIQEYLTGIKK